MPTLKEVKPITVSIPTLHLLTGLSEGLLYLKANEGSLPGCRRIGKRFIIHLRTFEDYMRMVWEASGWSWERRRNDI